MSRKRMDGPMSDEKPNVPCIVAYFVIGAFVAVMWLRLILLADVPGLYPLIGMLFCFGVVFWPVIVLGGFGLSAMWLLGSLIQWITSAL